MTTLVRHLHIKLPSHCVVGQRGELETIRAKGSLRNLPVTKLFVVWGKTQIAFDVYKEHKVAPLRFALGVIDTPWKLDPDDWLEFLIHTPSDPVFPGWLELFYRLTDKRLLRTTIDCV